MKKCIECGSTKKVYNKAFGVDLCPNCTRVWKAHPQHELPAKGEVTYDNEGRPICHICGRAFNKLMAHAQQRHGVTAAEYKAEFELEATKGVISDTYKELARKRVMENYDKVVVENLVQKGESTRYKNGDIGRPKDKVRLQTRKKLIDNFRNIATSGRV